MKFKIFAYLMAMILFVGLANAATIHGTIYDLSLKSVNNARVDINTSPKQFIVAHNGTYSFEVPNGLYTIKAQLIQKNSVIASAQENITVKQDGSYVLDLILFPNIEEGIEDIGIDINDSLIETGNNNFGILTALLLFLLISISILAAYYIRSKVKQKNNPNEQAEKVNDDVDLQQIMDIIKKEGGRITQKDIRKQIPLSEAKISLMIAELEHKEVIEKIKKGRGNIIVLKKK